MRVSARSSGYAGALLLAGTAVLAPAAAQASIPTPTAVPCSSSALVAAIQHANNVGTATLLLSRGCNYVLTTAATEGDGLPPVTGNLLVVGSLGSTISRDPSAAARFRVIDVAAGGRLTLVNVTVTNGNTSFGGGILDLGTLALRNVKLTGNTATFGGGLYVAPSGHATASFSEFAGNTGILGGGIFDDGTIALRNVKLTGNTASKGGGLELGDSAQATVSFSQLTGNTADGVGGGAINSAGQLAVDHSTLSRNTAASVGGGLRTEGPGTSRVSGTLVIRNRAGDLGGGIANEGTTVLTGDRVVFNRAADLVSNRAADGGGIANSPNGTVTLRFTLVAFNFPDNCSPRGTIRGCRH